MASVYVLYSNRVDEFYIGSCKDLSFRLEQHLDKHFVDSFTTKSEDWELYHLIDNLEYKQARLIESHIKRMKSRIYIQNLREYPEIAEKLKSKYP